MKNRLTNNIGLKLASVFLAIVIWLLVNSANNPTVSENYYNIPVKLLNTELITDSNQVYEVLENTDVIGRVTVRAPRSVISELKAENIIATADVSELSSLDTISIKLSTDISGRDIVSINGNLDTVRLNIENKRSKALSLKATVSGEVETGYKIGDITTGQNLVRISGPQSVIDQITKAAVDVDVTGMTSDIVTNAEIKLYDAEDNVVETRNITQNIKTVDVRVGIGQLATIPINFTVIGSPAAGYQVTGETEVSGNTVTITGKANVIKNVSSIEIPLDITDRTEDLSVQIDLRQYLPDNVSLADSADAYRTAAVHIEQEVTRTMSIREERVRVINLPEGYKASISGLDESISLELSGLSEAVSALETSTISGTVDIAKWMQQQGMEQPEPGFYTVGVEFNLPEGITLLRNVSVTLHISEIEEDDNE